MNDHVSVQPVRGTRDVLPPEQIRLEATQRVLEQTLAGWGYQPIDLPLVEHRVLYSQKAGEETVGKLYEWVQGTRALALRPEWSASVLRAYVRAMQSEPLPLRLRYAGPVLRYERPQRGTYRQFTQVGTELIGGLAPRADAETIALGCAGLEAAGVADWTLHIGHVGVVRAVLASLGLAERTASQLLWSMERLRREGVERVQAEFATDTLDELFDLGPLRDLPDEQLQALLLTMLRAVGLPLENSTRSPEVIVARLVRKLRRGDPQPAIVRALAVLERLSAMRGSPASALAGAVEVLQTEGISNAPVTDVAAIIQLVEQHGVPSERVVVDFGLHRGLHYHSGMIFEIIGGDGLQLCGGGRYNDLVSSIGGPSTPAVGFAFGLERVAAAATPPVLAPAPLVVVTASDEQYSAAVALSAKLRSHGYQVLMDVRDRAVAANLRDAARRGARAVVVAEDEATIVWHDLQDGPRRGTFAEVVPDP